MALNYSDSRRSIASPICSPSGDVSSQTISPGSTMTGSCKALHSTATRLIASADEQSQGLWPDGVTSPGTRRPVAIKRATRPIAKSRESSGFFKFERRHTLITSAGVTQSSTALARMSSVSVRDSGEIDIRGVFHAFTPVQTDVRKPVVRGSFTGHPHCGRSDYKDVML